MTADPTGGLAAQILAVADSSTRDRMRVEGLEGQMAALQQAAALLPLLRRQVASLADRLDILTEQGLGGTAAAEPQLWDWSTMDTTAASEAWAALITWVRDVLDGQYRLVGDDEPQSRGAVRRRVPPCWYRHRDVVFELSWLAQEWTRLYRDQQGTPARAGDWHDRYLPGVLRRIRSTSTAAGCIARHVDPDATPVPDGVDHDAELSAAVQADVSARPPAET